MKQEELLGKKFNLLTVVKYIGTKLHNYPSRTRRSHLWLCECECGNKCEVTHKSLLNNEKKSCGCLKKIKSAENCRNRSLPKGEAAIRLYYRSYQRDARDRALTFKLTDSEFRKLIFQSCHYCNSKPTLKFPGHINYPINGRICVNGIDRKNNKKGYTLTNVVPCCNICNKAKRDMNYEDFLNWIYKIKQSNI